MVVVQAQAQAQAQPQARVQGQVQGWGRVAVQGQLPGQLAERVVLPRLRVPPVQQVCGPTCSSVPAQVPGQAHACVWGWVGW